MTKTQKKPLRKDTHQERKSNSTNSSSVAVARVKEFSKRVLHDYVIPMTRTIEHRLLRLEQSL